MAYTAQPRCFAADWVHVWRAVCLKWGFRRDYWLAEYYSVGTYFNDHSSCAGKPACAHGQGMPRGPTAAAMIGDGKGGCTESNVTGGGNCYFVDSTHSNFWRNLRIINDGENIAYIEYDMTCKWNATDSMGSGLQFYELYDVGADPYQLKNLYATTDDATKERLHGLMAMYYACAGAPGVPSNCG